MSNLRKFQSNYNWSSLSFPTSFKEIKNFEINNRISINILGLEGKDIYLCCHGGDFEEGEVNLLSVTEGDGPWGARDHK